MCEAVFQEEWSFIGPQAESCCFPLAQKKAAVTDSPLQSANTGGGSDALILVFPTHQPSLPPFLFPKDWFWNYALSLPSVCTELYICVHWSVFVVRVHMYTRVHAHTHTGSCTCTCLNASLGNCLNGIRGEYGSCWGMGLWEWHGFYTRIHTRACAHTLHSWHKQPDDLKIMVWWENVGLQIQ